VEPVGAQVAGRVGELVSDEDTDLECATPVTESKPYSVGC